MNISQNHTVDNSSRVVPTHFAHAPKALARAASRDAGNSYALPQKPHLQKSTKDKLEYKAKTESRAARLVSIPHDHNNQSLSESFNSRTITVLISFLKLGKYDDAWLKLGKQLLLLKKSTNKQKLFKAALACFKSSIKAHPDNYVSYYFSGLTLCLLGRYAEALRMFDLSLRKNTEESTALLHTLSEMLSITEGIRLVTGNSDVNDVGNRDVSMQKNSSPNNKDLIFNHSLDKLERTIINKLQRHKIDGAVGNSMHQEPKRADETWSKYFELGMYWFGREEGNHKSLMYFKRCLQLNPKNEQANYYVGLILQKQGRYHESLEAYKQAISLRPDEGFYYYYMASQVYTALEESKEAIEMIDKAIA